jgi:opacity protein-like surface antigen
MTKVMMMMIKKNFFCLFFLFVVLSANAQNKDFGIWYGAGLKHEIIPKLDLNISAVVRTFKNAGKVDQGFLEVGVEYKFNDYFSAGGAYRLAEKLEDDSNYHPEHKLFLDLKSNINVARFTFSGRLRFQSRFKTYFERVSDKIPDYTLRMKLKAGYDIPSFPVSPYIYYEPFLPVFNNSEKVIGKYRASAGLEYKISKKHSIDASYIFQRDYLPDISDINIISVSYNFQF